MAAPVGPSPSYPTASPAGHNGDEHPAPPAPGSRPPGERPGLGSLAPDEAHRGRGGRRHRAGHRLARGAAVRAGRPHAGRCGRIGVMPRAGVSYRPAEILTSFMLPWSGRTRPRQSGREVRTSAGRYEAPDRGPWRGLPAPAKAAPVRRRSGSGGPPGLQNQWPANSGRWVRFPSVSAAGSLRPRAEPRGGPWSGSALYGGT